MVAVAGQLHTVTDAWPQSTVTAFVFDPSPSPSDSPSPPLDHLLLFVSGLGDSYLGVPYLPRLATVVAKHGWALGQANLRSAGNSWGGLGVKEDAEEIAVILRYFQQKEKRRKIVLMGFSTGCQDAIAYLHLQQHSAFPQLAGVILQAPVSDREPIEAGYSHVIPKPEDVPEDLSTFVPPEWSSIFHLAAGCTYRRWLSLVWKPEEDEIDLDKSEDFFSSDLSDERLLCVFGTLQCPILVFLGSEDTSYTPEVKAKLPELLKRFEDAVGEDYWSSDSGILEGAGHNIEEEAPTKVLLEKVERFIQGL